MQIIKNNIQGKKKKSKMEAKFVISKQKALEQYNKVKEAADIVSYSSKTNPKITRILEKETDCMFSIHLTNELKHISDRSRVIFLAQGWNQKEIKELTESGIRNFVVDNEPDLDEFLEFLKNKDIKVNLLLRLKLKENTLKTERYFVFGMKAETVNKRIKELRENPKIGQLGIHFHRKTQNMSEWNFKEELEDALCQNTLKSIDIMNIGGGLPSEYANTNVNVINQIFVKIKKFRQYLKEKDIKLMIEPGRFIAAPAGKLVAEIIRIYDNNIIVNASVYNSDMDALIVPVKLKIEGELSKEEGKPYVIKGITPCSMDLFRYKAYLKDPKEGDKIVFLNAGAYNFTTNFCDLEELKTEVE